MNSKFLILVENCFKVLLISLCCQNYLYNDVAPKIVDVLFVVLGSSESTMKLWKGRTCLHTFVGHAGLFYFVNLHFICDCKSFA